MSHGREENGGPAARLQHNHTEFSVHVPELGELMVRLPKSDPLAMSLQPGDTAEIGWRADQALALRAT